MKRIDFSNKRVQLVLNVIIWCVVFALPYLIDSSHHSPPRSVPTEYKEAEFFKLNLYTYFFWVASFYLNIYLLLPKLLNRRKYWLYAFSLLLTFFCVMLLHSLLFKFIVSSVPFIFLNSVRFNFPAFIMVIAISVAYKMTVDKIRSDKLQMQKDQENMKTELAFLRSQISPHFLLNVLNNIVALNRLKSDELEPTLMKLSGLMQYMLYETDEEKVLLKTEAEYLQSYIDLQKQRFGNKVKVNLHISLANDWGEIEPMLLIPFVENAFKHGIGMIEEPEINIDLTSNAQNELFFRINNKYNPASTQIKDKTSGIGLNNVQRRLNILYGSDHRLAIEKDNARFKVSLFIKLHG
jgi:two-component system LytT family sensor kinase